MSLCGFSKVLELAIARDLQGIMSLVPIAPVYHRNARPAAFI